MATTSEVIPASRTRSTLLVVLAVFTGAISHQVFNGDMLMALWGFAAGAVAALVVGAVLGWVVERRQVRADRRGGRG